MSETSVVSPPKSDLARVQEVVEAYADRMRLGDADSIVDLFTEDAAVMTPDRPTAIGRAELREVYTGALCAVAMAFSFDFDQISVSGDMAFARTRSSGVNTVRSTGKEVPSRYREIFVLRRDGDAWRIASYMFQPQPAGS